MLMLLVVVEMIQLPQGGVFWDSKKDADSDTHSCDKHEKEEAIC